MAEADRTHPNPGDARRVVFERAGPWLVLIDEWVAYARELYRDDKLPAGTFDTHSTFAQMLTEAARAAERTVLVVSIPASEAPDGPALGSSHEVGGAGGREALRRLRFGHRAGGVVVAAGDGRGEFRARAAAPFQPFGAANLADRDATARVLGDLDRTQAADFPVECRDKAYVDKIKAAYPSTPSCSPGCTRTGRPSTGSSAPGTCGGPLRVPGLRAAGGLSQSDPGDQRRRLPGDGREDRRGERRCPSLHRPWLRVDLNGCPVLPGRGGDGDGQG